MAESNPTQVILTDDGIKIIKAQDTADNAASLASKADSAALIAQSKANAAKSAADSSYKYANSEIAVQSTATAKAQSKADDAFSKATTAINNGQATSQAVTDLKDGSKLTIAELENGLATKVANSDYASYKEQTASQIGQLVTNGAFSAYQQTTADLISSKVATKDFSAYQATTAKAISSKVESKDFNTYKSQTADTIASKVNNGEFSTYKTQTAKDINLRVTKGDLIDEINLQAGNTLISSSGQLTLSGKTIYFDTKNPVIIPSANITGTLMGKELTAGTINGSTINGSTINGTTFNAGDVINDANNTSKYYPMTITPDGSYKSTYFDSSVGLQSSVESGAIIYKHRSMIGRGQFIAYDSVINGQGLELQSGYTSTKDTTFSNPKEITGYVIVNANDGITLHGDNQQITFNGTSNDPTPKGIIITPYGNINPNGTQNIWYVGNGPTMKTASFGIDGSGTNNIQFNRSLDIGNFNINTYHTITSSDNGPIHFNRANGKSGNIYAATVHYESLAKASLLSIKKDVKKANTAYWAQLVNSIDLATYQYKADDNTSNIRLSSIVDDVNDTKQWQLPDVFIARDEKGKLVGVDDSVLLNATLATVQEQQKEIDQLNGHNMELEVRLNKLEAKLNG